MLNKMKAARQVRATKNDMKAAAESMQPVNSEYCEPFRQQGVNREKGQRDHRSA
jgi:hypothetical protein